MTAWWLWWLRVRLKNGTKTFSSPSKSVPFLDSYLYPPFIVCTQSTVDSLLSRQWELSNWWHTCPSLMKGSFLSFVSRLTPCSRTKSLSKPKSITAVPSLSVSSDLFIEHLKISQKCSPPPFCTARLGGQDKRTTRFTLGCPQCSPARKGRGAPRSATKETNCLSSSRTSSAPHWASRLVSLQTGCLHPRVLQWHIIGSCFAHAMVRENSWTNLATKAQVIPCSL